jgi:hypothetical protein
VQVGERLAKRSDKALDRDGEGDDPQRHARRENPTVGLEPGQLRIVEHV